MSDHLGNVLVTVSDRKIGVDSNSDGVIDYYNANVVTANDYYPFGQGINDRQFSLNNSQFRYGFNNKEKDNDINGTGVNYDYGARIYDSRLGRFLSVDPLTRKYASESPYCAFDNSPIDKIDPDGEGGIVTMDKQNAVITISSTFLFYGDGANAKKAAQIGAKIQKQWNAANGTTVIDGVTYKVKFKITTDYIDVSNPSAAKALEQHIIDNKDVSINFFRIGNNVPQEGSHSDPIYKNEPLYGPGGNTGEFSPADTKDDNTTTESHEYGHGLGESHVDPHDEGTLIGTGQPGIMAARGTRVDAAYTYDPTQGNSKQVVTNNGPVTPGSGTPPPVTVTNVNTVDPSKRVVTQNDIDNLHLDKLNYDKNGKATIGTLTPGDGYHPDPPTR